MDEQHISLPDLIFHAYLTAATFAQAHRIRMDLFYIIVFGGLGVLAAALELTKPADLTAIKNAEFRRFRNNYLLVYSLMMGASLY